MSWVIGRGGRIVFKADWTSAANIEAFVERYRRARVERPAGTTLRPYATEQLEFRHVDREMFDERLRRNGPRAYDEFVEAERIWSQR